MVWVAKKVVEIRKQRLKKRKLDQGAAWRTEEEVKASASTRSRANQVHPQGPGCHKKRSAAKEAREQTNWQKRSYHRLAWKYGAYSPQAWQAWHQLEKPRATSDRMSYEAGVRFKDSYGVMRCTNAESFVQLAIEHYRNNYQ